MVTFRGIEGTIKWGYRIAARVTNWTATKGASEWVLEGEVADLDTFAVSQRPLTFVAPHAKGAWVWQVETLQTGGTRLTAVLGLRE